MIKSRFAIILFLLITISGCSTTREDALSNADQLSLDAKKTFQSMLSDKQYPSLVSLSTRARAVIIVPSLYRAAFFFGGNGGNAVMLARSVNGKWSHPAFYTLGGVSFGLQFGGQASEVVIMVMTERGMNAIMDRKATLGADAGFSIGVIGKGVNAATGMDTKADMYAFGRSEGLFAGVSLEGSVIAPRESWNQAVYGQNIHPEDILITRKTSTPSPMIKGLVQAMP